MDFFVINRYQEEDDENKEVNAEENLANVLEKIKRKKQLRKAGNCEKKRKIPPTEFSNEQEAQHLEHQASSDNHVIADHLDRIKNDEDNSKSISKKAKVISTDVEGFTILGSEQLHKKEKVKRVLPKWLTKPIVISVDLQNLVDKTSHFKCLDKALRKKLKNNGVKYFFPVQAEVIPWLIKSTAQSSIVVPRDICVSAPTGSGKTLAFVLPVVQALLHYTVKKIRALVILPTQDLAIQVFKTFRKYTDGTNLDVLSVTGKTSFENEQKQLVHKNAAFGYMSKIDILVCSAGRLVDHMKHTPGLSFNQLEFLIIDEADRVLDNVQHDWLYHLEKHIKQDDGSVQSMNVLNVNTFKVSRAPQKLLFSATLSQDPEKLQKLSLFQPLLFTSIVEGDHAKKHEVVNTDNFIGKYTTPKELSEKYIVCSNDLKPLVLYEFIKSQQLTKTIVFTHSMKTTHRLCLLLKSLFDNDLKIQEVSSNLDMKNRNVLIDNFSKGNIDILVCTDALARGIDLPGIQCVISYSPPKYLKTYIHRAGRTARAGELGTAVTLLETIQVNKFLTLLQQADKNGLEEVRILEQNLESLGEKYGEALNELKKAISQEEEENLIKMKLAKRTTIKRKRKHSTSKV